MKSPRSSPWTRRLIWAATLALLGALPALWFASGVFRVGIYQTIYPFFGQAARKEIFEKVRAEGRPDVAWRMYAENHAQPEAAWSEAFNECVTKGPYVLRGLEDELIDTLRNPEYQAAHAAAMNAACYCRMKDPRLAEALAPFLEDPQRAPMAAYLMVTQGQGERALPTLIKTLKLPPPTSLPSSDVSFDVLLALEALRILGPPARPALEDIRAWAELPNAFHARHGLATLWILERDDAALTRLKEAFRASASKGDDHYERQLLALQLAEIGQTDSEAMGVLERWIRRRGPSALSIILQLSNLGPIGAPNAPILESLLADPDPAIRVAARQALDTIAGEKP